MCFFSGTPPEEAKATGATGAAQARLLSMQGRPNSFQASLCWAPYAAPCTCCITCFCPCCSACYWRKRTLEYYGNGLSDYECCQGYLSCPCCPLSMFKGTCCGLCLEGCLCDTFSFSATRMLVMDIKDIHPDPADFRIIRCSKILRFCR